jgi:hypothetical protein
MGSTMGLVRLVLGCAVGSNSGPVIGKSSRFATLNSSALTIQSGSLVSGLSAGGVFSPIRLWTALDFCARSLAILVESLASAQVEALQMSSTARMNPATPMARNSPRRSRKPLTSMLDFDLAFFSLAMAGSRSGVLVGCPPLPG